MLSSSRAVSPSPAMSAAMASRRRPSRMASAMKGSSSTISTRMLPMLRTAHIAGICKAAYALATAACLEWQDASPHSSTKNNPLDLDDRRDRPRDRGRRHRHPCISDILVGDILTRHTLVCGSPAPAFDVPPRDDSADVADGILDQADGVLPTGVTVFDDSYPAVARLNPDLLLALRAAASGCRHPVRCDERLAVAGVPGSASAGRDLGLRV